MNSNRTEGLGHQAAGAVKELAGKLTGNPILQAKGVVEKLGGKAQHRVGRIEDALK